jgi:endonuclease YncB( thermonuclease family)
MTRLLASILLLTAPTAHAEPVRVIDGDSLEVAGEDIRLWGIDAVEGNQICQRNGHAWRCGDDATLALQTLVDQGEVACTEVDTDRYGRTVATCSVAGEGHRRRDSALGLGSGL